LKKLINKWIMEHRRQDDYKSIMLEYFWQTLLDDINGYDGEAFDIDNFISDIKHEKWFRKFYEKVLWWGDFDSITYNNFKNTNKFEVR
jgi:hypothetical protein